jgi:hypothetical protein
MSRPHVHPRALSALLALSGEQKMEIARRAGMSPGHLHDLETFRNRGLSSELRRRVALAFANPAVTAASLTCWCPRPGGSCLSLGERP